MIVTEMETSAFDTLIFDVVRDLTPQQATRYGLLLADRIIATCLEICTEQTRTKCLLMKEGIDLAWSRFLRQEQIPVKALAVIGQAVPSSNEEWGGLSSALVFTSTNAIADFIEATLDGREHDASYLSRCIMDLFDVIRDESVVDDEQLSALWSDEMSQQLSILGQIEMGIEVPRNPHPKSFLGNLLAI